MANRVQYRRVPAGDHLESRAQTEAAIARSQAGDAEGFGKAKEKGLTLIPLRMYFTPRGIVKCEMGICRGLKLHDKRDRMKKADAKRDMERAVRRG